MYQRQPAPADATLAAPDDSAPAPVAAPETDTVTLASQAPTPPAAAADVGKSARPAEVFAEIWKDGMKIGTVYTDGQAVLPNELGGTTSGGHGAIAYLRAEEVAQRAGGEVHYIDIPALQVAQTRAQLRSAYGV